MICLFLLLLCIGSLCTCWCSRLLFQEIKASSSGIEAENRQNVAQSNTSHCHIPPRSLIKVPHTQTFLHAKELLSWVKGATSSNKVSLILHPVSVSHHLPCTHPSFPFLTIKSPPLPLQTSHRKGQVKVLQDRMWLLQSLSFVQWHAFFSVNGCRDRAW